MAAIIQLVLRYILLGITTVLGLFGTTPTQTPPIIATHYESPTEALSFLFTPQQKAPSEVIFPTSLPQLPSSTPPPPPIPAPIVTSPPPVKKAPSPQPLVTPSSLGDAVVNIICTETIGTLTRTTTGSGVIISPRGTILTNAHVAVELMRDNHNCRIRIGSIATEAYRAELLYIPDAWIETHQTFISSGLHTPDTGELDFAFLHITESSTQKPLPSSFPYIVSDTSIQKGDAIEIIAYPAERVGILTRHSKLARISDTSTIRATYSFGETTHDLISTGKVSHAEQGSSGGAIVRDGTLIGIVANVNKGTINALTMSYIQNYFEQDTDISFVTLSQQKMQQ